MSILDGVTIATGLSEDYLNERQLIDYQSQRANCLKWLLTFGKDPDQANGYAFETVKSRGNRMDMFYRWVWTEEGHYTADITHDHADAYMEYLAYRDTSNVDKSNHQKAVKCYSSGANMSMGLILGSPI
ncbi:hypothetical protein [Halalkalicoccus tibetensis]|uniref:Uncharacterized protein n=1 Tax=Halalkalicoccus tibetensis TaxID=175632 RepID=A0ABD5V5P5_9EURY